MESDRRATSACDELNIYYRLKRTRKLLPEKPASVWNISTHAQEGTSASISLEDLQHLSNVSKLDLAHPRNAYSAVRLDRAGGFWLRLKEVNISFIFVDDWCLSLKMHSCHTYLRVPKSRHNVLAHSSQDWRNLSTTYQELCWVDERQCFYRRYDWAGIRNLLSPWLELRAILNTLSLGYLVYETMGRVRWWLALILDVVVSAEVLGRP